MNTTVIFLWSGIVLLATSVTLEANRGSGWRQQVQELQEDARSRMSEARTELRQFAREHQEMRGRTSETKIPSTTDNFHRTNYNVLEAKDRTITIASLKHNYEVPGFFSSTEFIAKPLRSENGFWTKTRHFFQQFTRRSQNPKDANPEKHDSRPGATQEKSMRDTGFHVNGPNRLASFVLNDITDELLQLSADADHQIANEIITLARQIYIQDISGKVTNINELASDWRRRSTSNSFDNSTAEEAVNILAFFVLHHASSSRGTDLRLLKGYDDKFYSVQEFILQQAGFDNARVQIATNTSHQLSILSSKETDLQTKLSALRQLKIIQASL